jgi:putative toxin-antitoxin system antitoxin component (TIGR02293 family)
MRIPGVSLLETLQRPPPARAWSEDAARKLIRKGLPARAIADLAKRFDTSKQEIQKLVGLSKATGARTRAKPSQLLKPAISDRAARLYRIYAIAHDVFEDEAIAARWFKQPNRILRGERPLDMLDTDVGSEEVVRLLGRIEYGIYS